VVCFFVLCNRQWFNGVPRANLGIARLPFTLKTKILVKGISAADAHAAAQRMLAADPSLVHLSPLLSPASFVVDG
jgi:hypothetical protein